MSPPRPEQLQNISKLTLFFRETQLENRIGPRTRGADVRRTTFCHFCQIFRSFLEFGAHERRWRFLYSKTWQLYKVELSFPERYTQFFNEFSTVLFKMIFLDTKPKGVPFTKIRFSSNFSFWDGLRRKMRFGMNLQWIVQCFDEEWGFYLQKYEGFLRKKLTHNPHNSEKKFKTATKKIFSP